ncbi:unnamed protein product [Diamesa serratosioi]
MDDMILHCNQNTIYVLNTSYNYGEFDMIGMFGTPAGRSLSSNTTAINSATKMKSKATNALLDNQLHDKIKETNNNLIKKRPNFLKFFNDNFMKSSTDDTSSESTCKSEKAVKKSRKSSKELYQEATDMLGISCTFSDNCRCLDCQSRYFDCDDDSDTYSNLSNVIIDEDDDLLATVGDQNCFEQNSFYCDGTDYCYDEDCAADYQIKCDDGIE